MKIESILYINDAEFRVCFQIKI